MVTLKKSWKTGATKRPAFFLVVVVVFSFFPSRMRKKRRIKEVFTEYTGPVDVRGIQVRHGRELNERAKRNRRTEE